MSDVFGDVATSAIYQAMQGLWAEQQAAANNVANVNTPNFKAQDVDFESSLAQAIANGDPSQMQVTTTDLDRSRATRTATTSTWPRKWSTARRRGCSSRPWSTP